MRVEAILANVAVAPLSIGLVPADGRRLLPPYRGAGRRKLDVMPAGDILAGIAVILAFLLGINHDRLHPLLGASEKKLVKLFRLSHYSTIAGLTFDVNAFMV